MIPFSCLRVSNAQGTRQFFTFIAKRPQAKNEILKSKSALQEVVRNGSHFGDGYIGVPRFGTRIHEFYVRDHAIKYFWLSMIPIGALSFYNMYIGPAELKDIPEGYEPRHWEYYRTPTQRFMHKWVYSSHEQVYERNLHLLDLKSRKAQSKQKYRIVSEHMLDNTGYKGWYYETDPRLEGVQVHDKAQKEEGIFREYFYGRPPIDRSSRLGE